jgi:hypothetical protein
MNKDESSGPSGPSSRKRPGRHYAENCSGAQLPKRLLRPANKGVSGEALEGLNSQLTYSPGQMGKPARGESPFWA